MVDLSNSAGSFSNPVTIGYNASSPIAATIPSGTITGTGYRLRVRASGSGIDGSDNGSDLSINTCTASGIANYQTISNFELYPNPASDNLIIKCEDFANKTFTIYDGVGRKVLEVTLTSSITNLNIENLENGFFIYHIIDQNKAAAKSGKFSISK